MTIEELIERLKKIPDPQNSKIVVGDLSAGMREIDEIEDVLDRGELYVIKTKRA